jgi:hypothetical protein
MYHVPRTFTRATYAPVRGYRYLPNQYVPPQILESLDHTLLLISTVDYDYVATVPRTTFVDCVDHDLEFTQELSYEKIHVSTILVYTPLILQSPCLKYSYTHHSQTISRTITHILEFTSTATGTTGIFGDQILESIEHDLILTQDIDLETFDGLHLVTDTLTLTQTIAETLGSSFDADVEDLLEFTETLTAWRAIEKSISHDLVLDSTASQSRFIYHRIAQTLSMTSSASTGGDYNRTINDYLNLLDPIPLTFSHDNIIQVPAVLGVIVPRGQAFVRFKAGGNVIVLPAPKYDDSESTIGQIKVKRSMIGGSKVYVKRSNLRTLQYTFSLTRTKALSFQQFMADNHSALIHITNWKGENWFGYFLTNPLTFTERRMYDNEVSIEFEGIRVS